MGIFIDATDIYSISDAIAEGITTPELLAAWTETELIDGAFPVLGGEVWASDPSGDAEEYPDCTPAEAATEYATAALDGTPRETQILNVTTYRLAVDADGAIVRVGCEHHKIITHPPEPECSDEAGHDWVDDDNVMGHGGGVRYSETCARCGLKHWRDTWATDHHDGTQGHEVESYMDDTWE